MTYSNLCVNKEVVVFNRKLHKLLKNTNNVEIIQAYLTRDDYTHHGIHLRISGKEKLTRLIVNNIKESMSRNEETPLILKWKEEQKNSHQNEPENKPSNKSNEESNPRTTGLIELRGETLELVEEPPSTTPSDQSNVHPRTSNRIKKTPTTMNEDFLWLTGPHTRVH